MGSKTTARKASQDQVDAMQRSQGEAAARRLRRKLYRTPPFDDLQGYRAFLTGCIEQITWGTTRQEAA